MLGIWIQSKIECTIYLELQFYGQQALKLMNSIPVEVCQEIN